MYCKGLISKCMLFAAKKMHIATPVAPFPVSPESRGLLWGDSGCSGLQSQKYLTELGGTECTEPDFCNHGWHGNSASLSEA